MAGILQAVCFPVYRIPKGRRSDSLVMDRRVLSYLNPLERLNCGYCEYANGVLAYVQEIAGRTEQYWCAIKHAIGLKTRHSRYSCFLDFGDAEQYRQRIEEVRRDFRDLLQSENLTDCAFAEFTRSSSLECAIFARRCTPCCAADLSVLTMMPLHFSRSKPAKVENA